MNGGRSGNRGECTQVCRLPFKLIKNGEYVNKEGYLIDNIDYNENTGRVKYNGVEITKEHTKEYLPMGTNTLYSYVKLGGKTYYFDQANKRIIARLNENTLTAQYKEGHPDYNKAVDFITKTYWQKYITTKWATLKASQRSS